MPMTTENMPQFVFNDFIATIPACYALYCYMLQYSYIWPVQYYLHIWVNLNLICTKLAWLLYHNVFMKIILWKCWDQHVNKSTDIDFY